MFIEYSGAQSGVVGVDANPDLATVPKRPAIGFASAPDHTLFGLDKLSGILASERRRSFESSRRDAAR